MTLKKVLLVQILALFGGTVFAWSKLLAQLDTFYTTYGTLFKVAGCATPNPLTTACFLGSTAFLVALFWSVRVYQAPSETSERWLRNFLAFGVAFAASVVLYEAALYYELFSTALSVTCSPGVSPVKTPCFTGMLFFIAAFTTSVSALRRIRAERGEQIV